MIYGPPIFHLFMLSGSLRMLEKKVWITPLSWGHFKQSFQNCWSVAWVAQDLWPLSTTCGCGSVCVTVLTACRSPKVKEHFTYSTNLFWPKTVYCLSMPWYPLMCLLLYVLVTMLFLEQHCKCLATVTIKAHWNQLLWFRERMHAPGLFTGYDKMKNPTNTRSH